jgi:hypothetical protein
MSELITGGCSSLPVEFFTIDLGLELGA